MQNRSRIAVGAVFVLLWIGALGAGTLYPDVKKRDGKTAKTGNAANAAVKMVDDGKVPSVLTEYKNKVIVANFWATWCGPCREEFPELVKLYQKYQNQGLVVLGFSMDDTDMMEQVKQFLQDQKADFPAYLVNVKDMEKFLNSIDKDWPGAIPATFIYDRNGKLTKRLIGAQEYNDFEKTIKPLMETR